MDQIKCECSICLNIFERPRGLPCLHNFCTKCLQQHIDSNREGEKFSCPLCRISITPPDTSMPSTTWASSFPIANVVNDLIEALSINNQQNKSPADTCEICLRKNVNVFCNTCKMILCQNCSDTHSIESPGHKFMIDKDLVMSQSLNENGPCCTVHKSTELDLFCFKCDTFICIKCTYGGHAHCSKDGQVRDIHVLVEEKRNLDRIQVVKLKNGTDEMNKLVEDIDKEQEKLLLSKEKNYTKIDKIIDATIQLLEKKRATGKSSLEQIFNSRHRHLENTSAFAKKRLEGLNVRISKLQTNLEIENKFVYLCESKKDTVKVVDTLLPRDFNIKSDLCFSVDPEFYLISDKMQQLDIGNAFITQEDAGSEKMPWYNFETPEKLTIKVYSAEITKTRVDGIVNPTDDKLTHSQKLSRHIIQAAGLEISAVSKQMFKSRDDIDHFDLTDVCVTQAGNLDFKFILHAVLPTDRQIISKDETDFENLITRTVHNCLFLANSLQLQSVALPSFCFSYDVANSCTNGYLQGVLEFSETHCTNFTNTLREVHFVDSNLHATHLIQTVFKKRLKIIHDIAV